MPAEKLSELPPLSEGEELKLKKIIPKQHFTEPPPRYNEGSLVKTMEENGVGRPSTYAPIIENIKFRGYVIVKQKAFYPTDLGKLVDSLMTKHFPQIVDVKFTAHMENNLDQIELGKAEWIAVLGDFYKDFAQTLKKADKEMERVKVPDEPTNQTCDLCGQPMVIKTGRFGKFTACSNYPTCKNKVTVPDEPTGQTCNLCGQPMVIKAGRFSKFLACSNYPTCKNTASLANIGVKCPLCDGDIVEKRTKKGRIFYSCNKFPACKFSSWKKPTKDKCPQCNSMMVIKSENEKTTTYLCSNEKCAYLLKK
jgi:DNA topoisomerase I